MAKKVSQLLAPATPLPPIFRNDETYAHTALMQVFNLKTARAVKNFVEDSDIPYAVVNGVWFVSGADVRTALRATAKTHRQRQSERADRLEA